MPYEGRVRSGERVVGLVEAVLECEDDRFRDRSVTGFAAPVFAGAHDLAAALDVQARLVEPPALGFDASEVRPHPHLERASAALDDDGG